MYFIFLFIVPNHIVFAFISVVRDMEKLLLKFNAVVVSFELRIKRIPLHYY